MDGVDLAQVVSSAAAKTFEVSAAKMPLLLQVFKSLGEGRDDMFFESEKIASFSDIDGSQLASPRVYILKDVMVDELEVARIKFADYRLMFELTNSKIRRLRFELS
jgi:hypothetical protein